MLEPVTSSAMVGLTITLELIVFLGAALGVGWLLWQDNKRQAHQQRLQAIWRRLDEADFAGRAKEYR